MPTLSEIRVPVRVVGLHTVLAELEAADAAARDARRVRRLTITGLVLVIGALAYLAAGLLGVAVGGGVGR